MTARGLLREHRAATALAAAASPLVAAAGLSTVRDSLTTATQVLVLVAVVVAFSTTGLRGAGLAASVSAAVWFDFFLTEPYHSFAITDPNDLETAALLLVIGGMVVETALWGQRQEAALSREAGYVDGVLATAESVAGDVRSPEELARAICLRIREVLDLDTCRFEPDGTVEPLAVTLNPDGSLTRGGRAVDVDRDGLPVDSLIVLPVYSLGERRGRFLLAAGSHVARPNLRQRRVAVLLAEQMAATLNGTVG